jgi:hypothetical protein
MQFFIYGMSELLGEALGMGKVMRDRRGAPTLLGRSGGKMSRKLCTP